MLFFSVEPLCPENEVMGFLHIFDCANPIKGRVTIGTSQSLISGFLNIHIQYKEKILTRKAAYQRCMAERGKKVEMGRNVFCIVFVCVQIKNGIRL